MTRVLNPKDSAPVRALSQVLSPAPSRSAGFTLLELLVVLVIIGVLATMVSLAVSGRAVDDRMQAEARRIESLIRLASDEVQAKGFELGVRATESGFEFLTLDNSSQWSSLPDGPFRPRQVQEPFYLELRIEGRLIKPAATAPAEENGRKAAPPKLVPQVLILSTGEMTAFTLDLKLKDLRTYYRVEGDALGQLKSERREDKL